MTPEHRRASQFLSYLLRHRPQAIGLSLDDAGWADVGELVAKTRGGRTELTAARIAAVVRDCPKQRFALSDDGLRVRANQGHSVAIDLRLDERAPPPVLFHGTAEKFLASIRAQGLRRRSRHHVHLSSDEATARVVGARHGAPVVLRIDAAAMVTDGHVFYRSENGVWLTEHVPAAFLTGADA